MQITLNGAVQTVPGPMSVLDLIRHLDLVATRVAVEINREIVPRAEHGERGVAPGDVVEIVHFVGGG